MKPNECCFTNGNKLSVYKNGGNFLVGWVTITGKNILLSLGQLPVMSNTAVRVAAVNLRSFSNVVKLYCGMFRLI